MSEEVTDDKNGELTEEDDVMVAGR